ncbi:hypothetical protein P3T75_07030 [Enterococcus montenegrensis]|uniref:hypothetical protein n=1 Tax=Enterococcus montenegrensis TaxID=3031993 RepID=UPI00249F8BC9|nr:hypothetical protein [Enterococcus montenegrensis]WHA08096.1 hypothetical protein P3T75_07030 [Enterococcus montenegrensis]
MNPFFTVFKKTQQFLLLQAYADEIMSEEELMTFLLNETTDARFSLISQKGLYLVTPNVSLDEFTYDFYAPSEVQASLAKESVAVLLTTKVETIALPFSGLEDAKSILADINYLWSN